MGSGPARANQRPPWRRQNRGFARLLLKVLAGHGPAGGEQQHRHAEIGKSCPRRAGVSALGPPFLPPVEVPMDADAPRPWPSNRGPVSIEERRRRYAAIDRCASYSDEIIDLNVKIMRNENEAQRRTSSSRQIGPKSRPEPDGAPQCPSLRYRQRPFRQQRCLNSLQATPNPRMMIPSRCRGITPSATAWTGIELRAVS